MELGNINQLSSYNHGLSILNSDIYYLTTFKKRGTIGKIMDKREQLAKLSILPVNKTVVFYSPVEDKDVLVRTGTIGDGSCCYHATLHAYSKEYVSMNEKERGRFVAKLRSSLASKVDRERWEEISGGLVAKIPFQENINSLLHDFYRHVAKGRDGRTKNVRRVIREVIKNDQDNETFALITEMVSINDFEKRILPDVYDRCADDSIQACKDKLVDESERFYNKVFQKLDDKVESRRVDFCVKKLGDLARAVANEADSMAFGDYISNLKDISVVVDRYTIGLISNRFNRDIYFIDSRTRMPYREGGTDHIKGRKSIILMWTGGVHYEVVGRLLPGNRIQREFRPDEALIKRINMYLCHPEKIPDEYPNLIPYLPKEQREKIGLSSKSRSRSGSRSYSDDDSDYEDSSSDSGYEDSSRSYSDSETEKKDLGSVDKYKSSPSPRHLFSQSPSPKKESRRKHRSPSPKKESRRKHRSPSPKESRRKHRSPSPKESRRKHRSPSPKESRRKHSPSPPKESRRKHRSPSPPKESRREHRKSPVQEPSKHKSKESHRERRKEKRSPVREPRRHRHGSREHRHRRK
jgi:hypothetical protein